MFYSKNSYVHGNFYNAHCNNFNMYNIGIFTRVTAPMNDHLRPMND